MSAHAARLEAMEGFLAEDPDDAFTRYALALEHASAGNTERALTLLRETISRDAAYVPAHHQLGALLARMGRKEEAALTYEHGIAVARAAKNLHAASEMQQELESMQEDE
jgi:thioredoxin-like negative regulator of GroEL